MQARLLAERVFDDFSDLLQSTMRESSDPSRITPTQVKIVSPADAGGH
jgi:hypothetical protein